MKEETMQQQLNDLTRPQLIALAVQKGGVAYTTAVQMTKEILVAVILTNCDDDILTPEQA
jgi:hypothetical protein